MNDGVSRNDLGVRRLDSMNPATKSAAGLWFQSRDK